MPRTTLCSASRSSRNGSAASSKAWTSSNRCNASSLISTALVQLQDGAVATDERMVGCECVRAEQPEERAVQLKPGVGRRANHGLRAEEPAVELGRTVHVRDSDVHV